MRAGSVPIYLDHNATTPVASAVLDAMRPHLEDHFGNPSGAHAYGVVEHPAVLAPCRYLDARFGYRLTLLPVDGFGVVDPADVRRAIEPRHRADQHHARQQRGRHAAAHRRDRGRGT